MLRVVILFAVLICLVSSCPAQQQSSAPKAYTGSSWTGYHDVFVEAMLYNPPVDEVTWKYPYKPDPVVRKVETKLVIAGRGIQDGAYTLTYQIESGEKPLHKAATDLSVANGWFEKRITLGARYPEATRVWYQLAAEGRPEVKGHANLRWSRFRGRLKYLDGGWRSSYIALFPNGFNSVGEFWIPVMDDGRFDALLPSRVYSVMNVNGAGYSYDAMERWGWDYDLTRDRDDVFTIGRTELYSIHAFDIKGPISTIFVAFRPTALSRILQFDENGDGRTEGAERTKQVALMRESPTVIGPDLEARDVTVWLNGKQEKVVQFSKVPEYDGNMWQVQYVLQIFPQPRPARGVWHEIKLEVRSTETLRGKQIVDFGEGSVGFFRP